jgi:phage gp29-like protein
MSTLQQILETDLNLLGLVGTRIDAVLGYEYHITMPKGVEPTDKDKKRIAEMTARFNAAKMQSLFRMVLIGRIFGASAVRLIKKNTSLGTTVVAKQSYDLTELDFDLDSDDGLIFVDTKQSGLVNKTSIDPDVHIFVRYSPLDGIKKNYIGSLMRTNMLYSWIKYYDYWNWAKGNEKFADPTFWASYRKGAQKPEIDAVIAGLEALGTDGRAAFSDDVKLQLIESMRSGSISAHKELVETIKSEQAISILGQTLTTDLQGKGSKAAAQVHNTVRADIMWSDLIATQDVVSNQYLMRDYIDNYGEPDNAFPVLRFDTEESEDVETNARVFGELKSADPAMKFKRDELYRKTGFTEPQEGDATI